MKKQLEKVQLKENILLIIPDDVLYKIKYLCKAILTVEWSGILLYTIEGTIKEPDKMKIILKDIIPMHKGNSVFTEYTYNKENDDKMIDYFNENTNSLKEEWKIGHIHSHHSMNVFFSVTDIDELDINAGSHNFYLSLIVNNWMDFCAKVAIKACINKSIEEPYYALDENGKEYKLTTSNLIIKKEKLYMYDCDIKSSETDKLEIDNTFINSVNDIINKANNLTNNIEKYNDSFDKIEKYDKENSHYYDNNYFDNTSVYDNKYINNKIFDNEYEDQEIEDTLLLTVINEFTISLLDINNSFTNNIVTIEDALKELVTTTLVKTDDLCKNITDNYFKKFEIHFENDINEYEVLLHVINIFEKFKVKYPFLVQINSELIKTIIKQ